MTFKNKFTSPAAFLLIGLALMFTACSSEQPEVKTSAVATVGKAAPGFTLLDTDGRKWSLSELRGQVVFINFWATWCPPCREEMPAMQSLYEFMPSDKFKMLAILSNDDPAMAENYCQKAGVTFPILIDPDSEVGQAYGITGVPETYIIDKHGILRGKYLGPRPWFSTEARQMVQNYIDH